MMHLLQASWPLVRICCHLTFIWVTKGFERKKIDQNRTTGSVRTHGKSEVWDSQDFFVLPSEVGHFPGGVLGMVKSSQEVPWEPKFFSQHRPGKCSEGHKPRIPPGKFSPFPGPVLGNIRGSQYGPGKQARSLNWYWS